MNLLLSNLDLIEIQGNPAAVEITQVEHDSRRVRPGALFCCLPGATTDGHDHAAGAVAAGATGLLCEHLMPLGTASPVVQAVVPAGRVRPAMARAAATFHGHPAAQLTMAGVTGTNGKTTVAHLLGAVLSATGTPATVLGTLSGARTTPEATDLQALLAAERDRQVREGVRRAVAMEVSSHALAQARVDGIRFDVAVFTNLSREHLDFHHTMEEYFAAKASLFVPERAARAVIGTGTSWGRRLLRQCTVPAAGVVRPAAGRSDRRGPIPAVGVPPVDPADVQGGPGWTELPWRGRRLTLALTGATNASNAVLAGEAALALGIPLDDVVRALALAAPVPGRMEVVAAPRTGAGPRPTARPGRTTGNPQGQGGAAPLASPYTVLVDYAHSPDALAAVLNDARQLTAPHGQVHVVFGAGGDRDRGKRPEMGAVASRSADHVVLTSDNPRSEDPAAILADLRSGTVVGARARSVQAIADRQTAIAATLGNAHPGDVVVVAGKGHETTQEIRGRSIALDDRAVIAELIEHIGTRG